jgi:starch phosphorylase
MISNELFPCYKIRDVTNSVQYYTWTSSHFRILYDCYLPGWANEPELLVRVGVIPETEIWEAHLSAKKVLIDDVNQRTGVVMDSESLTIGFARRMKECSAQNCSSPTLRCSEK